MPELSATVRESDVTAIVITTVRYPVSGGFETETFERGGDQRKKVFEKINQLRLEERKTLLSGCCRRSVSIVSTPTRVVALVPLYFGDRYAGDRRPCGKTARVPPTKLRAIRPFIEFLFCFSRRHSDKKLVKTVFFLTVHFLTAIQSSVYE